jgi:CheY-like chemotaxis protein
VNIEGAAGHGRRSTLVIVTGTSPAVAPAVTDARSLLVVDDDAAIREIIQAVLEVEGYAVFTAADGAEAIARLRAGLRPRLILLDLRMPGMDGRAFRDVQAAEPDLAAIPVVILSGDGDAPRVAASLGLEWLLKPVHLDHLLAVVARHCGRPGEPATGGIDPSRPVTT